MKIFIRRVIKNIYSFIAKCLVKSNNIKVIVVFGARSSDICVEAIYSVLNEKGLRVKRSYLGFEKDLDFANFVATPWENYTFLHFLYALVTFPIIYFFKIYNNLYLIVDVSTVSSSVCKYYTKFLQPEVCVFLDTTISSVVFQNKIIEESADDSKIIVFGDSRKKELLNFDFKRKFLTFGENIQNTLSYSKVSEKSIHVLYNGQFIDFDNNFADLDLKIIAAAILASIIMGVPFEQAVHNICKFQMPHKGFQRIFEKFKQ